MAKAPTIKFPRISAGFYGITMDGEFVGYVMKEVNDSKEAEWYIFDDNTPGKDIAMLHPDNAIDTPDDLFREAKDSAKQYFLNRPKKMIEAEVKMQLKDAEWSEVGPSEAELVEDEYDPDEDHTLYESEDGSFVEFESNLFPMEDDESEMNVEELALV